MTPINPDDARVDLRLLLSIEVEVTLLGEFASREELLAWLGKEGNREAMTKVAEYLLGWTPHDVHDIGWLDDNRQVYVEKITDVEVTEAKDPLVKEE